MNDDRSVVLGSARASRAGDSESFRESGTLTNTGAFFRLDFSRSSFRRAAETSTRAACAPRVAAVRSMFL